MLAGKRSSNEPAGSRRKVQITSAKIAPGQCNGAHDGDIVLPRSLIVNAEQRGDALTLLRLLPDACTPLVFFDPQFRAVLDKLKFGNESARQRGRAGLPAMSEDYIDSVCLEIARVLAPSGYLIAEAQRLINACAPEFRSLVQAALQTGCRYGELCRIEVTDFNRDAGTLAIRKSKSDKARHVVLTDEGAEFFKGLSAGRAGNEPMFGRQWGVSHQLRPMAEAVIRARITPAISFHGLRHTWASHAVMNGVPLLVVAKNLGHAVEKHYGHLAPSYIADAIRAGAPRFGMVESSGLRVLR